MGASESKSVEQKSEPKVKHKVATAINNLWPLMAQANALIGMHEGNYRMHFGTSKTESASLAEAMDELESKGLVLAEVIGVSSDSTKSKKYSSIESLGPSEDPNEDENQIKSKMQSNSTKHVAISVLIKDYEDAKEAFIKAARAASKGMFSSTGITLPHYDKSISKSDAIEQVEGRYQMVDSHFNILEFQILSSFSNANSALARKLHAQKKL